MSDRRSNDPSRPVIQTSAAAQKSSSEWYVIGLWDDPIEQKWLDERMKGVLPVTMSGCPALAAPAGFNAQGLPMGIQIVGPNQADLACLQLAYTYDGATAWATRRLPPLLGEART